MQGNKYQAIKIFIWALYSQTDTVITIVIIRKTQVIYNLCLDRTEHPSPFRRFLARLQCQPWPWPQGANLSLGPPSSVLASTLLRGPASTGPLIHSILAIADPRKFLPAITFILAWTVASVLSLPESLHIMMHLVPKCVSYKKNFLPLTKLGRGLRSLKLTTHSSLCSSGGRDQLPRKHLLKNGPICSDPGFWLNSSNFTTLSFWAP